MESVESVLIVDYKPADIRFIKEAVKESAMDLTLHSATTADEPLGLVDERPGIDGVLLDWNRSQTTGEAVLDAVKKANTSIPIVVMTDSQAEVRQVRSSISNADMAMEKATNPDDYIDALRSVY